MGRSQKGAAASATKIQGRYLDFDHDDTAIQNGFTSVMMDGSLMEDAKSPAAYHYNVAVTREVARLAHMVGASVEGELGCLGSLETGAW